MPLDLDATRKALAEFDIDGWLLYDFRASNVLARRVLGLSDDEVGSRRLFYCIPAHGAPRKLVHRIESAALDYLPGEKHVYLHWQQLEEGIAALTAGMQRVAMEYSPRAANPYVSRVDAGTVEIVRETGVEVVSSGDLVQQFEATLDDRQRESHEQAARLCRAAFDVAFGFVAEQVRSRGEVRETQVQQRIMDFFRQNDLTTHHPPIVGAGRNSSDCHYAPAAGSDAPIREGDFLLVDLWAKLDRPGAIYADYTRVAFVGHTVPEPFSKIFDIVADARDAGIDCVRRAFAEGRTLHGWEVDDAVRDVIDRAGYGDYFVHRTGHSIGQETHGNGANMDNLETRDERRVLRRTCFSIEPGIYLPEFGVRSEVDVYVDERGEVHVTGGEPQREVLALLEAF
jgi:Xaa-Pro aminopeptidase